ncbi:MAG TPA: branched-chain amino acid ABC transporter substrate-binding protein [Dehalococcoidia bacterium]|nr:branched-chain amino acid ABC transporter substrate-binding protein [Dehalococcoidia bacterium]
MKASKRFGLLGLVTALSLVAAACGGGDGGGGGGGGGAAEEKIPVTLYYQGALSGPVSYLVIPGYQGATIRVDELNADENYPAEITLEQADTQGSPDQAPPVVEEVIANPETVGVIGPGFSGESAASGDSYNEAQIPFMTPSATNPALAEEGWDYWYRAIGNDAGQGSNAGLYLAQVVGAKSLFLAHDKSDYGQPLAEVVRDTAEGEGVEIAGFEGIETGAEDFSSLVSAVRQSGADSFFFGGYDADFGKIVRQMKDAGVNIDMMSGDGSVSSTFLELAGNAAEGTHLIIPSNLGTDFVEKYNQEFGGEALSVPVYTAEGYDVAAMFGEGIKQAIDGGAQDPEAIRQGIKEYFDSLTPGNEYQGEAKAYAFDEKHELTAEDYDALYYFYRVENGEMKALGNAPEVLQG